MISSVVRHLPYGPGNPRNSEGAFVTLNSGRILYAYSRYNGDSWNDHACADIYAIFSDDGGQSWSATPHVVIKNDAYCNIMSVSLLRLFDGRIALFYIAKNTPLDARLQMRISDDEGETWSAPVCCEPPPGYFVTNNDRVVQLRSRRLIVPAGYHRATRDPQGHDQSSFDAIDSRSIAMFFFSDDNGASWHEAKTWWALPGKDSLTGLQEPGVVELSDGSIYAFARTDQGCQYDFRSFDGGETWTVPAPSSFISPASPLSIKRIPATGDLLAVWNDHTEPHYDENGAEVKPAPSSWGRTPLAVAISRDDGKTWSKRKLIESDPQHGYCYTAIHFTDDAALLAYCCGGNGSGVLQDSCIRRIDLAWLYQ